MAPAVARIDTLHFQFANGRHRDVVEIVSVHHVHQLSHTALNFLDSLRLTMSTLVCPLRYVPSQKDESTVPNGDGSSLRSILRLGKHFKDFFADIRYLASSTSFSEEAKQAWDSAQAEIGEVTYRFEDWVLLLQSGQGHRLGQSMFPVLQPLLTRVMNMVTDFINSIVQDIAMLFVAPNFVAREMVPPGFFESERSKERLEPAGVDVFQDGQASLSGEDTGRTFAPGFMKLLRHAPEPLTQPAFFPSYSQCQAASGGGALGRLVPREFTSVLEHRDVSGLPRRVASPLQLLRAVAQHTALSDLAISLQVSPFFLDPPPSCGSKLILYEPTKCLLDHGWAGYTFEINPLPPFNLTIIYAGRPIGPGVKLTPFDVHSIHVPTRDAMWSALISTYKSMNHHSPDLLFMSPLVGNCQIMDRLLSTGAVKPKLIYAPFNPLKAPPEEDIPNFFDFWQTHAEIFLYQITGMHEDAENTLFTDVDNIPVPTLMWQGQCTLASTTRILNRQGYRLVHVEHLFAAFMWQPLYEKVVGSDGDHPYSAGGHGARASGDNLSGGFGAGTWAGGVSATSDGVGGGGAGRNVVIGKNELEKVHDQDAAIMYSKWLSGWQCSPHARFLFNLEVLMGDDVSGAITSALKAPSPVMEDVDAARTAGEGGSERVVSRLGQAELRALASAVYEEIPTLRFFLERQSSGGRSTRGHCAEGLCECLPPYRGQLCEHIDPPRVPQRLRAAIHYITADTAQDLLDLSRSLSTLWESFNHKYDYPVVVFHDGLSPISRRRIIASSDNRVWLVLIERFKEIPPEWTKSANEVAQEFSVGYRSMIRWRSGPMFLERALADFDYAMTLDTDSYFPARVGYDPFAILEKEGLVAAFPHLGRESASVVVNFMNYFLLYCRLKDLHPRRTRILASLIEKNFKWYQQCLMLDIEVLRLDWFRGEAYQSFFRYMDSTGGFWLHRWGNNPFRTFAVGLLLDDDNVTSLVMPYAHQDFCSCGADAAACSWDAGRHRHECIDNGVAGKISARDLADGLLRLQPWRGADWQRSAFNDKDIRDFIDDQMTF
eukprot:TRINITY_DN22822_c1_g1_i1.p1 TRINITY_DN22822_c1_g1~~TRINITY_DN22822_c1_g1_i1.p1  ORF type:complete len:1157 (+),score=118.66 TRINITY_DN22822_c1_g1_i1:311-3472(+)